MPRNGLAFPVRVGGQIDEFAFLRRAFQVFDDLVLAFDGLVLGGKIPFQVHAHLFSRQVAQMAHGSLDHKIRPQVFADGLCLGRRFYNE